MIRLLVAAAACLSFFIACGGSKDSGPIAPLVSPVIEPEAVIDKNTLRVIALAPSGAIRVSDDIFIIELEFNMALAEGSFVLGSNELADSVVISRLNSNNYIRPTDYKILNDKILQIYFDDPLAMGDYLIEIKRDIESNQGKRLNSIVKRNFSINFSNKSPIKLRKDKLSPKHVENTNITLELNRDFKLSSLDTSSLQIFRNEVLIQDNEYSIIRNDHTLSVVPKNGLFSYSGNENAKFILRLNKGLVTDLADNLSSAFNYNFVVKEHIPARPENKVPLLVFQVSFSNIKFSGSLNYWQNLIFGNSVGQLNGYYYANSHGKHEFTPVRENQGQENDGIIAVDIETAHPATDISEKRNLVLRSALTHAYNSFGVDFSSYDKNSNAKIDPEEMALVFVFAGDSIRDGGPAETSVLPHATCLLGDEEIYVGGVQIGSCPKRGTSMTIFSERQNMQASTVGVLAHELGHSWLGLADHYDLAGGSRGVGVVSLMGHGAHTRSVGQLQNGQHPVSMSAFSKVMSGFHIDNPNLELIENPAANIEYSIPPSNTLKSTIYKFGHDREFFLVEHRNRENYDAGMARVFGSSFEAGLLIWHADLNIDNNKNWRHKRIDVEEASDNRMDRNEKESKELFFGKHSEIRNFVPSFVSNSDRLNSDFNDGSYSNINLTDISNPDPETGDIKFIYTNTR